MKLGKEADEKGSSAAAFCAVAIVAVAAASGGSGPGAIEGPGKTSVFPTPSTRWTRRARPTRRSITVTGKVKSQDACLSGRKIQFTEVTPAGSFVQAVTAVAHARVLHRDAPVQHDRA